VAEEGIIGPRIGQLAERGVSGRGGLKGGVGGGGVVYVKRM